MDETEYYTSNRISGFKKRYLIFLISFLAIIIVVWGVLWIKMADYQKGIDSSAAEDGNGQNDYFGSNSVDYEKIAQESFYEYIGSLSTDDWISIYRTSFPDSIDTDEDVIKLIQSKVLPYKNNGFRASDYSEENPAFLIGTKDNAVASFVFSKGIDGLCINKARVFETGDETITINAYSDAIIEINGNILEVPEVSCEQITVEDCDDLLINPVNLSIYEIDGVINPDVSIDIENSFKTFDNYYYQIDENNEGLMSKSEEFVKSLLRYYSQGKNNISGNMGAVLAHVDSSSPAAKVIRNTESGLEWVTPDNSISMEVNSSPACILSENCVFTEVDCECGNIYRVYFVKDDSGYRIVQFACVQ